MEGERNEIKRETDAASNAKDRQADEEERLVEKKTQNVILHSLHGVQERRERKRERQKDRKIEREAREKKGGLGEGREGRRGGG